MTPLLDLQDVSKSFPVRKTGLFGRRRDEVTALDQITLDVYKGETVSIVGESGCGKSTLARTAGMLLAPDSGTVKLNGRDVYGLRAREKLALRRQMHLVFQDPYSSLNPRLSVGEIVGEPLIIHKVGDARSRIEKVKKALAEVGLQPHHLNKYPHQFSGGQRQRIALARALILRPDLIIADEPLSALDVSVQGQIINLLADLKKAHHLTYIIISHDLSVIRRLCTRILVLYKGEIVETGPTEQILKNPQHPYTRRLLSAVPNPMPKQRRKSAKTFTAFPQESAELFASGLTTIVPIVGGGQRLGTLVLARLSETFDDDDLMQPEKLEVQLMLPVFICLK